jgi:uncharacterized protein (DUF1501 family)
MKKPTSSSAFPAFDRAPEAPYVRRAVSQSRRAFLRTTAQLSVTGAAAPLALNLAGIGAASAQTANDYRALVCVFLFGANDHNNTIIPVDTANYNAYVGARSSIARAIADIIPLTPTTPLTGNNAGRQFGLAKELAPIKPLWDQGKLAILANVGPLVVPTTKAQYGSNNVPLPPKLFSHNDQQSIWQSTAPEGSIVGWGGAMGDLLMSQNANSVFTATSIAGSAVFLAGRSVAAYQLGTSGPIAISGITGSLFGSTSASAQMRSLIGDGGSNLLARDLANTTNRSIGATESLSTAFTNAPAFTLPTELANNSLARQLQVVSRMIASRTALGAKRQIFFVSLGGFDTHDNQLDTQPTLHTTLAGALSYFNDNMNSINAADMVTTFTGSDFGRTLTTNGDGSDHGWGSHHFIMGGAVQGGRYYGTFPIMGLNNNDEVGSGRLLPTTSVDQLASTLALWMGVSPSDLSMIVPRVGNFATPNLGFMRS